MRTRLSCWSTLLLYSPRTPEAWPAPLLSLAPALTLCPYVCAAIPPPPQDRFEDAEELLDRIATLQPPDTQAVSAGYVEYLRIWLLLASPLGLPDEAERLTQAAAVAAVHAAAAVPGSRWKKMWQEMEGCCKEAAAVAAGGTTVETATAGAAGAAAPAASAEQQRAAPPSLSLADGPTSGTLLLDTTSLRQVRVWC